MTHKKLVIHFISLVALILLPSMASVVNAQEGQERPFFPKEDMEKLRSSALQAAGPVVRRCTGPITRVVDVGYEGAKFTPADYFTNPGGGEGAGFDKTPLLSTSVALTQGTCLDAHFSAIVGSKLYGAAPLAMFQVTLTRLVPLGTPRHMFGHFETPFGRPSPAVALEAERDVDTFGTNFFQKVGTGPHEVPPGNYRVDVWWSGAGPGGAVGFAFVLKLYLR